MQTATANWDCRQIGFNWQADTCRMKGHCCPLTSVKGGGGGGGREVGVGLEGSLFQKAQQN